MHFLILKLLELALVGLFIKWMVDDYQKKDDLRWYRFTFSTLMALLMVFCLVVSG